MKIIGSGIIIQNKRILLIKRKFNKKEFPNYWAIPGGGQENNETGKETTIREVKEEVGLKFNPKILFIENKNEYCHFYRYIGEFEGKIKIQDEECDGYGWFTYKESKQLLISDNMIELFNKLNKENYI